MEDRELAKFIVSSAFPAVQMVDVLQLVWRI